MPSLTATYSATVSPPTPTPTTTTTTTNPQQQPFVHPLPTLPTPPSTPDRTAYLAHLQSAIKTLQSTINTFLTQKMEDEKTTAAEGGEAGAKAVDDVRAEDMYGEDEEGGGEE